MAYYVLVVLICIPKCYVQIYLSFTFRFISCRVLCPGGAVCIPVCYVQIYFSFTFRLIPCGVLRPSGANMYTCVLSPDIFIFYFQAYSLGHTMS